MGLFNKTPEEAILNLKEKLKSLEQNRLKFIKQHKEISAKLYVGPHINSYHNIVNCMNNLNINMTNLIQKMGSDKINNIMHNGKDLLDLGGVNPTLYKQYLKERKDYLNLKKQKKLIENRMELEKNRSLIAINHKLNNIENEEELILKELRRVKIKLKR